MKARFAVRLRFYNDAHRTSAKTFERERQHENVTHLARIRERAIELHDGQADAALGDHRGIVDVERLVKPVLDQRVGHHEILWKKYDAGGVAMREANAHRPFEMLRWSAHVVVLAA